MSSKLVLSKTSMSIFGPCQIVLDRTKYQRLFGIDQCLMDVLDRTRCLLTRILNTCSLLQSRQWLCNSNYRGAMRMDDIAPKSELSEKKIRRISTYKCEPKVPMHPFQITVLLQNRIIYSFDTLYLLIFCGSPFPLSESSLILSFVHQSWGLCDIQGSEERLSVFFQLEHKCFHYRFKQTMFMNWCLTGHTQLLHFQRSPRVLWIT